MCWEIPLGQHCAICNWTTYIYFIQPGSQTWAMEWVRPLFYLFLKMFRGLHNHDDVTIVSQVTIWTFTARCRTSFIYYHQLCYGHLYANEFDIPSGCWFFFISIFRNKAESLTKNLNFWWNTELWHRLEISMSYLGQRSTKLKYVWWRPIPLTCSLPHSFS